MPGKRIRHSELIARGFIRRAQQQRAYMGVTATDAERAKHTKRNAEANGGGRMSASRTANAKCRWEGAAGNQPAEGVNAKMYDP